MDGDGFRAGFGTTSPGGLEDLADEAALQLRSVGFCVSPWSTRVPGRRAGSCPGRAEQDVLAAGGGQWDCSSAFHGRGGCG